jgi:hypothetical protein
MAGVPCGGWCPAGRLAEDGVIPRRYPLRETPSAHVQERTRRNVEEADGTVVLCFACESPGTRFTIEHARTTNKPMLLVDVTGVAVDETVDKLKKFVESRALRSINFAGPRASEAPGAYEQTRRLVDGLIRALGLNKG